MGISWATKFCGRFASVFHQQLRKTDVVVRVMEEKNLPHASPDANTNAGTRAFVVAEKLRRMVEKWQFPGVPRAITIPVRVSLPSLNMARIAMSWQSALCG